MAEKPTHEQVEEWFKAIDTDDSGKIDANELRSVVVDYHAQCAKSKVSDAQIDADTQAIMKEVDTSGDGKIDKEEFFKYFLG